MSLCQAQILLLNLDDFANKIKTYDIKFDTDVNPRKKYRY